MGDRLTGNGHVGDLAPAYALGALEPEERGWVDRHRRVCPVCDRRLVAEERMVSLLPFLVRAAPPPSPDVKVALLARVAHAHRTGASPRSTDVATLPPTPTIPSSRPVPAVRASRDGPDVRPNRRAGWATALLTAPLVLAVAVLGTLAVQFHAQAEELGAQTERGGQFLDRPRCDPAPPGHGRAAARRRGLRLLDAPQ